MMYLVRRKGLFAFSLTTVGENRGSPRSSPRRQQSTGLLHLDYSSPFININIKRVIPNGITLLMVRRKGLEPPTY